MAETQHQQAFGTYTPRFAIVKTIETWPVMAPMAAYLSIGVIKQEQAIVKQ